jgi:uncharacterized protein (TIGR03084 family)
VTTLAEVMTDLRSEVATLDSLLAGLEEDDWSTETPAVGWDIRDTVGHLADTDDLMFESVTENFVPGRVGFSTAGTGNVDDFTALQVEKVRTMPPLEVYAWWRSATARLGDHIDHLDPKQKYPWGGNMLSPLSLGSARIMETWAHSLDCHAARGIELADTDRLRHVAHLGLRALPNAFRLAGLEPPGAVRAELDSPSGEVWVLGPDDAPTVIRGSASDWCRVVTYRDRDGSAGRLQTEGPDGAAVVANARAFL